MVAKVLLMHHADVNAGKSSSWTPLHFASYYGHPTFARVLLEHGADVNLKNGTGKTPLRLLSEYSGNLETAQMLLEHGADPNTRCINNWDSLYAALDEGYSGLAQLLLKHGADPNARDVVARPYYTYPLKEETGRLHGSY